LATTVVVVVDDDDTTTMKPAGIFEWKWSVRSLLESTTMLGSMLDLTF